MAMTAQKLAILLSENISSPEVLELFTGGEITAFDLADSFRTGSITAHRCLRMLEDEGLVVLVGYQMYGNSVWRLVPSIPSSRVRVPIAREDRKKLN